MSALSLSQLATRIEEQQAAQRDLIVPANQLDVQVIDTDDGPLTAVEIPGTALVQPTPWAEGQMASHLRIPKTYWERMRTQAPHLLAENANHWLKESDDKRMIRLQRNDMRAYVSNAYRRLDHPIALRESLEALQDNDGKYVVLNGHVDEMGERMNLKVLFPDVVGEVRPGDTMRSGVHISNSEVGGGSYSVRGFLWRDYCSNGMIFGSIDIVEQLRRRHSGGRVDTIWQDDTMEAEARLLGKQTRDIVKALSSQEALDKMLEPCKRAAQSTEIEDPEKAVEVLAKSYSLSEMERSRALIKLIGDGDMTQWGAANAITALAHDASYQRAVELETAGAQLLTLQMRQWDNVRLAA